MKNIKNIDSIKNTQRTKNSQIVSTMGLSILMALGAINTSFAQTKDTQTADKQFNRFEYVAASKSYLDLVGKGKKDNYIYKQLADSYYNMFNTTEAIKWYALAVTQPQDAETYYKYAQMLKGNGKYEESNKQMAVFASKLPNDQRAIAFNENPNYVPKLLERQKLFDVTNVTINSDKSDFGAIMTNENQVIFSSARNLGGKKSGWTAEPYLDLFQSTYNPETQTLSPATAIESLNTRFHEGPASVSSDGKTIYFSRDSHADKDYKLDKKANAKFSQVYLYKATKIDDGTWSNITQLPINSKDYSVSNPSISKDGKTLYFNSDMPGGEGGLDIWKIAVNNSDNTYGIPENLGKEVNTPGTEQFAFISDEEVLYFSSSGRQGLGGLDVFMIDLKETNPINKIAQNVGKPVNSEKDDFAFTYNSNKNKGFFSSSRSGADDIFMATAICGVMATSTVTDSKTGAVLAGASVSILDDQKNTIATKIADPSGQVQYPIECDKAYIIQATKDGYQSGTFNIAAGKITKVAIAATLNPIEVIIKPEEVVLKPINFEYDKSNITKEGAFELDQLVMIMKSKPEMVIMAKSHTDNRGSDEYNNRLSDRRAKSTVQYIISRGIDESRISGKGYGKTEPKVDCLTNCTEADHAINRRSEFLIVK